MTTGRVQFRSSADQHRDVIVPVLPRRGPGTRGVKIWSTSDFIYLEQATRECDSPRSAAVVEPPPLSCRTPFEALADRMEPGEEAHSSEPKSKQATTDWANRSSQRWGAMLRRLCRLRDDMQSMACQSHALHDA